MNNDFEPVVGRRFQFRADPMPNWNGIVDCEVLTVEPLQRLSYNWGVGGSESGLQWVVLWTLTPTEGGTHVRMEQSGFGPDQQANLSRVQNTAGRNSSTVWIVCWRVSAWR